MERIVWQPVSGDAFNLDENMHIWRVSLTISGAKLRYLEQLLSDDEKERAKRFHFDKDRNHFIAARGQLRVIIGRYLNLNPQALRFKYNDYGKPLLISIDKKKCLNFNVSHSHELALIAISKFYEVGIDIEWILRPKFTGLNIAKRFFSKNEIADLMDIPQSQQRQAFFDCWTRKEAYIKTRGKGLSIPLNQFDVSLKPGEPARLLASRHDPEAVLNWHIQALFPAPDYTGAIVVNSQNRDMLCWDGIDQLLP